MVEEASLERSVREAMIAFAAVRRSFDAAKIAEAIGGAPVGEVEPIVERLFASGLLNAHGVLRHARTGASVLFNAYAGDPPGGPAPAPPRAPPDFEVSLPSWLDAFQRTSGLFSGVTAERVVEDARQNLMLADWEADDTVGVWQWYDGREKFMKVLEAIEHLAHRGDPSWSAHAGLMLSCVWRDDGTDDSLETLREMLGLPEMPSFAAVDDDFDACLAAFDAAAERAGIAERLYRVDHVEGYLVIKLLPEIFAKLVDARLLFAHVPRSTKKLNAADSVIDRFRRWLRR